jgi:hypothetical protein
MNEIKEKLNILRIKLKTLMECYYDDQMVCKELKLFTELREVSRFRHIIKYIDSDIDEIMESIK